MSPRLALTLLTCTSVCSGLLLFSPPPPLALGPLPAFLGPWREEGGLGRGGLAVAGSSQASAPLRTLTWERGRSQMPLPGPPAPRLGILVEVAQEPRCPDARGEALKAPGQGEGHQAPWMHPLPDTPDLGQFLTFLSAPQFPLKKEAVLWLGG